jgi:hypothetical protein
MQDHRGTRRTFEGSEHRVARPGARELDWRKTDLRAVPSVQLGAQSQGQELHPEADAEHGDVRIHRFGQNATLGS